MTEAVKPVPLEQMDLHQAKRVVRHIVHSSRSEEEIRRQLTESGFDGRTAIVTMRGDGTFEALVAGPYGQVITA